MHVFDHPHQGHETGTTNTHLNRHSLQPASLSPIRAAAQSFARKGVAFHVAYFVLFNRHVNRHVNRHAPAGVCG